MQEIKCPKCGEVFQVDESCYDQIVQQVRNKEFEKALKESRKQWDTDHQHQLEKLKLEKEKEHTVQIASKDATISERERKISELQARLQASETEREFEITKALQEKNEEISKEAKKHSENLTQKDAEISARDQKITELQAKLDASETEKNLAVSEALERKNEEISKEEKSHLQNIAQKEAEITQRDNMIVELRAKLAGSENEKQLAVLKEVEKKNQELAQKETQIAKLTGELKNKEQESRLNEQSLKNQYEERLKSKDEQIEYYKDFKARLSTKMVGESLEQHCLVQFNTLRMTAFPNAYFEKDNDVKNGSKGDFIFRENDDDDAELISIMFEMKNESDTTATKHKNEDFFKELDKDRNEKGCEYAILVSLLEIDNEVYNNGIVDVSYKYPKMYVIRPQFFIPMITLLRNAAKKASAYKRELQIVQNQQIDVQNFETNMKNFKEAFARNYNLASKKFKEAIDEIDKTISHLEKTKAALVSSENNLRLANEKAEDLSIKKLTAGAPSVKQIFDAQKQN